MALHLVTGYRGEAHITAADQGLFNAGCIGLDEYVLNTGNRFDATMVDTNTIRIGTGSLLMQGRHVISDTPQELTIESGDYADDARSDLIVMRYSKDTSSGIESVGFVVVKNAIEEMENHIYTGNILNGEIIHDMPLYRVWVLGFSIYSIDPLFQVLAPMADFQHGFYKQNMLINGDFQCNQRGQTNYLMTDFVGYTVDMWRGYNIELTVRNDGVKLKNHDDTIQGYLTQFIQLGKLETKTYTISARVDGKICTFTITPGGSAKEKIFEKFKISALTISTWDNDLPEFNYYNNKLKVNICPIGTSSIVINYVDVFEGTVAYPHVKEDPATAMMRCRRYIQRGSCYAPILRQVNSGNDDVWYRVAIPFDAMSSEPTLYACSWNYWMYTGVAQSGNKDKLEVVNALADGRMDINVPINLAKDENCSCVAMTYVLSCEHNPNGD